MIVECKSCGAPLDVDGKERYVRCSYCQKTNRVKTLRTLHFERPPGWSPPPTWTPPPSVAAPPVPLPRRPAPPPRRSSSIWLFAILMLLPGAFAVLLPMWRAGAFDFLPAFGFDPGGAPELRTIDLDAEATPIVVAGEAGTSFELRGIAEAAGCEGFVGGPPQVLLRTRRAAALTLEARSGGDDVMLLVTAEGEYVCDDDSAGRSDAGISRVVGPGDHRVWVGSYDGRALDFELTVEAQLIDGPVQTGGAAGLAGLAPEATPSLGRLALSPGVTHRFEGAAEPFVDLGPIAPSCRGFVPVAPHVTVTAPAPERVRFVTRDSDGDPVMAVRLPDGHVLCDDDSGNGTESLLDVDLPVGTSAVWVGSFARDRSLHFSLEVGAPRGRDRVGLGVDPLAAPVLGTVNLDVPGWSPRYGGVTRPEVDEHAQLDLACRAWVGRAPDLAVLTTVPRSLTVTARGDVPLELLVRGPDGELECSVEGSRVFAPGASQIWVGQRRRSARGHDFTLELTP